MDNKLENLNQSQKILNAAFKCISERGYASVSLRDIADEAGVVLSQLNYYYKNKEGLFTEIIKTLTQQYLNEIEDNLKKGDTEKEKMMHLIEYFQEMLKEKPELFKLLFDLTSMALWSESFKELLNDLFNNVVNLIETYIINDFSDERILKYKSPVTLSRMMLGTLFGMSIQVILANGEEDMIDSLSSLKALFE
ncbi:MAG: TetR/AcrR family transcriptional regulator [Sedimentibacter sp.]|jgi:AcrR family transcriptional regulator|uniref:TetR/AcrR family transcriptional regulator n=1 Tax=Sedimentibacter sp. MB31-C6 TaxID=3109366 RepID=UPI002DDCCCC2|nr:TetR/AcrR family transcriptional regulator [Sedimentibacter sp. MB36-C1]WSI03145.1 TetR/AcrR family transcriptional regulator [Sedimentibacter sp. MB36-C1]